MANPLLDYEFLKELYKEQHRVMYARITALDLDENPKEVITGRITQGNVNIDGSSSMRRSCTLTVATSLDSDLEDNLNWSLNTKIKVEVGLENTINNENYNDIPIIYFPLGVYVLSNFTFSKTSTQYTIQLQGKDKMCLLNGTVSGEIYASVDFGTEQLLNKETGVTEKVSIPVEDIIREGVREQAREPYQNIVIKDLPKYGLNLLEWNNSNNLYVFLSTDVGTTIEANNAAFNRRVYYNGAAYDLDALPGDFNFVSLYADFNQFTPESYDKIKLENSVTAKEYFVVKVTSGQTVGYEPDYLIYPHGEDDSGLTIGPGGTFTEILDKIVSFLGDYEYFYDVNGQFVFQKKQTDINIHWNDGGDFADVGMGNPYAPVTTIPFTWNFNEEEMVTSFNENPNLSNIKNDFSIWGSRSAGDNEIPIHLRYAIDKKPSYYATVDLTSAEITNYVDLYPEFKNSFEKNGSVQAPKVTKYYYTEDCPQPIPNNVESYLVDWREVIYQMAKDYIKLKHFDEFQSRLAKANVISDEVHLYLNGITGYEQYYVDLEANWRDIYRPGIEDDNEKIKYSQLTRDDANFDTDKEVYVKDQWSRSGDRINDEEYLCFTLRNTNVPILYKDPFRVIVDRQLGYSYNNNLVKSYSSSQNRSNHIITDESLPNRPELLAWAKEKSNSNTPGAIAGNRMPGINIGDTGTGTSEFGFGIYMDNGSGESDNIMYGTANGTFNSINEQNFNDTIPGSNSNDNNNVCLFLTNRYNLIVPIDTNVGEGSWHDWLAAHERISSDTAALDNRNFYTIYSYKRQEEIADYDDTKSYKYGDKVKKSNSYYRCIKSTTGGIDPSGSGSAEYWETTTPNYTIEYYIGESGEWWEEVGGYYQTYTQYSGTTVNDIVKYDFKIKMVRISDPNATSGIRYYTSEENRLNNKVGYVYRGGMTHTRKPIDDTDTVPHLGRYVKGKDYQDGNGNLIYSDPNYYKNCIIKSRISSITAFENSNGTIYLFQVMTNNSNTLGKLKKLVFTNGVVCDYNELDFYIYSSGRRLYNFILGDTSTYYLHRFLFYKKLVNNTQIPYNNIKNLPMFFDEVTVSSSSGGSIAPAHDGKQYLTSTYKIGRINSATGMPFFDEEAKEYIYSEETINYYQDALKYSQFDGVYGFWNPAVFDAPETLNFWFDFLNSEANAQISRYGVDKIQQRSKVTSDDKAHAIVYNETLNIAWEFTNPENETRYEQLNPYLKEAEYPIFNIPDYFFDSFKASAKAKSCKDILDQQIYQYTQTNESANFSALPIYSLEPNNLISIDDKMWVVKSLSLPLSYNGTMSVQCTRMVDRYQEEKRKRYLFEDLDFNTSRLDRDNYESSIRTSNVTLFNSEEAWNQNWEIEFLASTSENIPQGGEGAGTTVGIIGSSQWDNRQIAIQIAVSTNATLVDSLGLSSATGSKRLDVSSTNKIIKVKKDFRIFSGQLFAIFQLYINEELMYFGEEDYFARQRLQYNASNPGTCVAPMDNMAQIIVGGVQIGNGYGFKGHLDYLKIKQID